jgi:hypothetical protein
MFQQVVATYRQEHCLRRYSRRVAVTLERVDPMQEHQPKITMQIRANPAAVADPGKVRIGGESPSFGPVR